MHHEPRRYASPDVGADEVGETFFSGGFEFGTALTWSVAYP
jgi:hypothetical protein